MPRRKPAPAPGEPHQLAWCPLGPADWRRLSANLLPAERGALMNLLMAAWEAPMHGDAPCTVDGRDAALEILTGLSSAWHAHRDRLLMGWQTLEDGRLRHTWLHERWLEQVKKAEKATAKAAAAASKRWARHPARTQTELFSASAPTMPVHPEGMLQASKRDACASAAMLQASPGDAEVVEVGVVPPTGETTPPPASAPAGAWDAPRRSLPVGPPESAVVAAEAWLRLRAGDRAELHRRTHETYAALDETARASLGDTWTAQLGALRRQVLVEMHGEYQAERRKVGPSQASWGPVRAVAGVGA